MVPSTKNITTLSFVSPTRLDVVTIGLAARFRLVIDTGLGVISDGVDIEPGIYSWQELLEKLKKPFIELGLASNYQISIIDSRIAFENVSSISVDSIEYEGEILDEDVWGWNGDAIDLPQAPGSPALLPDPIISSFFIKNTKKVIDYRIWDKKFNPGSRLTPRKLGWDDNKKMFLEFLLDDEQKKEEISTAISEGMGFGGSRNGPFSLLVIDTDDFRYSYDVFVDTVEDFFDIFSIEADFERLNFTFSVVDQNVGGLE